MSKKWYALTLLFLAGCHSSPTIPPIAAVPVSIATPQPTPPRFTAPPLLIIPTPSPPPPLLSLGKRCAVHGILLQQDTLRIHYCLPPASEFRYAWESEKDREKFFPNSNKTIGGGCTVLPARIKDVLFCPQCRLAEEEWARQHPLLTPPRP